MLCLNKETKLDQLCVEMLPIETLFVINVFCSKFVIHILFKTLQNSLLKGLLHNRRTFLLILKFGMHYILIFMYSKNVKIMFVYKIF